jgi:cell division protein FtsQ
LLLDRRMSKCIDLVTSHPYRSPLAPVYQPESKEQLKQRRRQLRQQRRIRVIKSLWRFICMIGILTGLGWVINQPDWTISRPEQIRVEGNQYLSDMTIRSMLAIPYPKLIMELSPAQLTAKLIDRSSIANVKIDRGVLPPHLVVQIQDFPPVAKIMQTETTHSQIFIDERGLQLPISSYRPAVWRSLPTLKLRLPTPGTCPEWTQLYHAIHTSPVAIGIIDCRNPQNLILQTELGKVRLGSIGDKSKLNSQMQQLDRLRNWQKHTLPEDVELLDLENPESPKFQLKRSTASPAKFSLK